MKYLLVLHALYVIDSLKSAQWKKIINPNKNTWKSGFVQLILVDSLGDHPQISW